MFHKIKFTLVNTLWFLFGSRKKVDLINKKNIEKAANESGELVVLIHGIFSSYYRSMYYALLFLSKRNLNVVSIGYDYTLKNEIVAKSVKRRIDHILEQGNGKISKIHIAGFSLGGAIARYYIELLDGKDVIDKLVTVCAPIKPIKKKEGARMAVLLDRFLRQKKSPEDEVFDLDSIQNTFSVKHLAIYAKSDKIIGKVYPIKGLPDNVTQTPFDGGHLFISFNDNVLNLVADFFKK